MSVLFKITPSIKNLTKPTCFKNLENPTRIDHILTNHLKSFYLPSVCETALPDFCKLTLTVLKVFHAKYKPKIIQYRYFNHFDYASPRADLLQVLSLQYVQPGEFEKFRCIITKVLNIHAAIKGNDLRCNHSPFL